MLPDRGEALADSSKRPPGGEGRWVIDQAKGDGAQAGT
jgi:hypothetical protein